MGNKLDNACRCHWSEPFLSKGVRRGESMHDIEDSRARLTIEGRILAELAESGNNHSTCTGHITEPHLI